MELTVTPAPTGPEAPEPSQQQQQNPGASPPDRPAWLPEGMNSPEELAAAYSKLAHKDKPQESTEQTEDPSGPQPDASASKFVQDAGFDPIALSREIASSGDINPKAKEALVKKLEKAGLPGAMVDEYISGQRYAAQAAVNDIMAVADGQEGFQKMAAWAGENLDAAELKTFNDIMAKGDAAVAKLTVKNLYARYRREANIPGRRVRGGTRGGEGDVFRSFEQMVEAQRDERYAQDPAYREEVEGRIERSLKAGTLVTRTR